MYIAKNVSQYFVNKLTENREEIIVENPAPRPDIIRHYEQPTHNLILPPLDLTGEIISYTPIIDLETEINNVLDSNRNFRCCTLNSLALTNALWYSLSDFWEFFPHNLTILTLDQLILVGHYLWEQSEKDDFDPKWVLEPPDGGGKRIDPYYRAFMYFRDYPLVCHPLISYEYKKRWRVLHYDKLLNEVDATLVKWMNRYPNGRTFL